MGQGQPHGAGIVTGFFEMTKLEVSYARSRLRMLEHRIKNTFSGEHYLNELDSINMRSAINQMLIVLLVEDSYPHLVPVLRKHLEVPDDLTLKETLTLLQLGV